MKRPLKIGDRVTGSYRTAQDPDDPNRSIHLAADDFDTNGTPVTLTITYAQYEMVTSPGNRKKKMAVLHFKECEKGLALNVTNATLISDMLGTNQISQWESFQIALYRTTVKAFGKSHVPCVRVTQPQIQSNNGVAQ